MKKNGMSTEISQRSAMTGQVTGKDKNGKSSDVENNFLISMGLMNCLKENNSARADDMVMKQEMLKAISTDGYVSLNELTDDISNKKTLDMVNTYFLGMGIQTDLITDSLKLSDKYKNVRE